VSSAFGSVTPHAGVWIEIFDCVTVQAPHPSHPTRVCGLKFLCEVPGGPKHVTPHAGVWIEIGTGPTVRTSLDVTPHAGVWIEISRK